MLRVLAIAYIIIEKSTNSTTKEGDITVNTLRNIDEIKSLVSNSKITLLYISSESCGVCKVIFPRLENMLKSYPEVEAARTDIQELPLLSGEYNVFTIPCVLVFVEGKEIVREARYINFEQLNDQIDRYYNIFYKEC
jgi:thiol-disulfide isomerase/thioredoxin